MFISSLIGLCFLHVVIAQIPIIGPCPSFDCCKSPLNETIVNESNGIWYLYGGDLFFFDKNTRCQFANFSMLPDNYIYINVSHYDTLLEENRNYIIFGNYSLANGNVDTVISDLKFPLHYEIIQWTSEYIIVVSCSECGFFSKQDAGLYVYIITKSQSPLFTVTDKIFAKLEECKIPTDSIVQHSQTNCGTIILGNGC
ncbi:unnamed protein product [Chironomus riparius]|uniref:Uncharacterized protein n=1 Tax=Chironomus riparius TaxID=315576 RepID=A0A9N9RSF1_9DIPT|nr:unnamed protein product [Chironomus riparius]